MITRQRILNSAALALALLPAQLARAAAASLAPADASHNLYAVAAYLFGLATVFLLFALGFLLLRMHALQTVGRHPAPPLPSQPDSAAKASPAAADEDALATIEETKLAIHGLVRNLAECVTDLLESNASYDSKMAGHKTAIQKAMTLAGLEEIERLLLGEIEEVRQSGQRYRAQLDQAHARIREQNELMERIQADARIDHLTQLPNRRALDARLGEEFERARRYGNIFSIAILDIDHFKAVNDSWGHVAGDKLLQLVAMMIQKNIRLNDMAARYGGEEFALVLAETKARPARTVAEKIRRVIEASALMHERTTIRVTVSAGVGEVDPQRDSLETLLNRVDAALYRAKQSGRNRVELAE
jgi:diguanylate cyclase